MPSQCITSVGNERLGMYNGVTPIDLTEMKHHESTSVEHPLSKPAMKSVETSGSKCLSSNGLPAGRMPHMSCTGSVPWVWNASLRTKDNGPVPV